MAKCEIQVAPKRTEVVLRLTEEQFQNIGMAVWLAKFKSGEHGDDGNPYEALTEGLFWPRYNTKMAGADAKSIYKCVPASKQGVIKPAEVTEVDAGEDIVVLTMSRKEAVDARKGLGPAVIGFAASSALDDALAL